MKNLEEEDDDNEITLVSKYDPSDESHFTMQQKYDAASYRCGLDLSILKNQKIEPVNEEDVGKCMASNNVLKGFLSSYLNLSALARDGLESYDPGRFVAGKLRFGEATALVFPNGKMVITGTSSIRTALLTIGHVRRILTDNSGRTYSVRDLVTTNVVCSMVFPKRINLRMMNRRYPIRSKFDDKLFPGLFLNFQRNGMKKKRKNTVGLLFFGTGKVAAAGLRTALPINHPNFKNERNQILKDLLIITRQIVHPFFIQ